MIIPCWPIQQNDDDDDDDEYVCACDCTIAVHDTTQSSSSQLSSKWSSLPAVVYCRGGVVYVLLFTPYIMKSLRSNTIEFALYRWHYSKWTPNDHRHQQF